VKRQNERLLRYDLWMMRDAIDKYKDAADRNAFQIKLESRAIRPIWRRWSTAWTCKARS